MKQCMCRCPVCHQMVSGNGLLHVIFPLECPAQLHAAIVFLPSDFAFLPLSSPPTEAALCSGCQSSGSQAPLPILGPLLARQTRAVTVLPDTFRQPGPPLPNSRLQAACSHLRAPLPPWFPSHLMTPAVSTAQRTWSRQAFPSPCPESRLGHSGWD